MYLIHAYLRTPGGIGLPADAGALITGSASLDDGLEHVSVHLSPRFLPVLGLFIRAPAAEAAWRRADALCRRALYGHRVLGEGVELLRCVHAGVRAGWPGWTGYAEDGC